MSSDVHEFRVRPAQPEDEDALWPLAVELATSFVQGRAAFARSLTHVLADDAATVLVATAVGPAADPVGGTAVVGYVHVLVHRLPRARERRVADVTPRRQPGQGRSTDGAPSLDG